MTDTTANEIRALIERYELVEAEKKDLSRTQKEIMHEADHRGYDTAVLKALIALRKKSPDDVAEFEAVLETYKAALGMA